LIVAGAGLALAVVLGGQGLGAYATIRGIDAASNVQTPNPLALFDDLTSNGIRVGGAIDQRSRQAYAQALERFVLDGTGVLLGGLFALAGLFVAVNR
jgi:hypothetical protein